MKQDCHRMFLKKEEPEADVESRAYVGHENDRDIQNFIQFYPRAVGTRLDDCQTCHRAIGSSNVRGATASDIQIAIDRNRGGMGSLSFLTPEEVQAIADALNQLS